MARCPWVPRLEIAVRLPRQCQGQWALRALTGHPLRGRCPRLLTARPHPGRWRLPLTAGARQQGQQRLSRARLARPRMVRPRHPARRVLHPLTERRHFGFRSRFIGSRECGDRLCCARYAGVVCRSRCDRAGNGSDWLRHSRHTGIVRGSWCSSRSHRFCAKFRSRRRGCNRCGRNARKCGCLRQRRQWRRSGWRRPGTKRTEGFLGLCRSAAVPNGACRGFLRR